MTPQPYDPDSFVDEFENLCRKYRISIMPNERTGTFALVDFDEDYVEWVRQAPRFGLGEGK